MNLSGGGGGGGGGGGMLEQPYYLMAAQASNFLIHPYSQTQSFRTALIPSKNIFSKLFSQKLHFQNRSQK